MTIFEINLFWLHIAPTYYGLMYAISFAIWYYILKSKKFLDEKKLDNFVFYIFVWMILWWRIWYVLFYNLEFFFNNPIKIPAVWEWWMSFHWWALWVITAAYIFSRKYKLKFFETTDTLAKIMPIWLFFWRIWNYINKELLWWEYSWFLAVVKNWKNYFPSPLLEAFLEWIILFIILNFFWQNKKPWFISWAFLFFYWIFRFAIEFIRLPDKQIWYIWNFITMWQILSIPLIIIWLYLIIKNNYESK